MKRGAKFLIAFITASLTFGSLMAFVGPQYAGFSRYGHHGYHGGWHHHRYDDYYHSEHRLPDESSRQKQ